MEPRRTFLAPDVVAAVVSLIALVVAVAASLIALVVSLMAFLDMLRPFSMP